VLEVLVVCLLLSKEERKKREKRRGKWLRYLYGRMSIADGLSFPNEETNKHIWIFPILDLGMLKLPST